MFPFIFNKYTLGYQGQPPEPKPMTEDSELAAIRARRLAEMQAGTVENLNNFEY